jgi:acetyl-CoA acyltransferase
MRPVRPVYIAAQAVTPFIGKGHPDFILKGHPDFGKRENPTLEDYLVRVVHQLLAECQIDPSLIQRAMSAALLASCFPVRAFRGNAGRADE